MSWLWYVSTPFWLIVRRRTLGVATISPAAVALLQLALVLFVLLVVVVRVLPAPGPVSVLVFTAPGPTLRLVFYEVVQDVRGLIGINGVQLCSDS